MKKKDNVVSLANYKLKKDLTKVIEDLKIISNIQGFSTKEDLDEYLAMLQLSYDTAHAERSIAMTDSVKERVKEIVMLSIDEIVPDLAYREKISIKEFVMIEHLVYDTLHAFGIFYPETQQYADELLDLYR